MNLTEADWSFAPLQAIDSPRAERLERAGTADQLIDALVSAVADAATQKTLGIAVDSLENRGVEWRAIVQFPVTPDVYDWFFNARTGYRGQHWISPKMGLAFNSDAVEAVSSKLLASLPDPATARHIKLVQSGGMRIERDVGSRELPLSLVRTSLDPGQSKLWICERLYHMDGVQPLDLSGLVSTHRLKIPRWERGDGELGTYALDADHALIDLKGGFVHRDGRAVQRKDQAERAEQIYATGRT